MQRFTGTADVFLAHFSLRAYSQYLHIRTNLNSNSLMFFFRAVGYLYGQGIINAMRGGYSYTSNSIINQHACQMSGSRAIDNFYRASNGDLCLRINSGGTGYSEGRVAVFYGQHGPVHSPPKIVNYKRTNSSSNQW